MIKCNIGMANFDTIVKYSGKELNEYRKLSDERKLSIISRFWTYMVKFILLNHIGETMWKEPEAKDWAEARNLFSMSDAIVLKGKKQDDKAYLVFTVSYNPNLCVAEINPLVAAKDKETEERIKEKVSQSFIRVEKFLSKKITKEMTIRFAFETFFGEGVCSVRGDDAVTMYKIMNRTAKHYPKFADLSDKEKIEVMAQGYRSGMKRSARERDIYTFSRHTFEVLEKSGLADVLYKYEGNLNKYITYVRLGGSPNFLPGTTCPRFIDYGFELKSGTYIRCSYLAFDLWELLAKVATI